MKTFANLKSGDRVWIIKVERSYMSSEFIEAIIEENHPEHYEARVAVLDDGIPTTKIEIVDYFRAEKDSDRYEGDLFNRESYYLNKHDAKERYLKVLDQHEEYARNFLEQVKNERTRILNL